MSRSTSVSKKAWSKYYFVNSEGVLRFFLGRPHGDGIQAANILLELGCQTRVQYPRQAGIFPSANEALQYYAARCASDITRANEKLERAIDAQRAFNPNQTATEAKTNLPHGKEHSGL